MKTLFDNIDSILVIEDTTTDFVMLEKAFRRARFQAQLELVKSAAEGYSWFDGTVSEGKALPDLVLLDLGLPGESGMDLLKNLKAMPVLKRTALIVYSASESPTDMAKAGRLGADWYFVKKSSPQDLDYVMRTLSDLVAKGFVDDGE